MKWLNGYVGKSVKRSFVRGICVFGGRERTRGGGVALILYNFPERINQIYHNCTDELFAQASLLIVKHGELERIEEIFFL